MVDVQTTNVNRYAGSCSRCGSKVAAGAGVYSQPEGVAHALETQCKTTTKTYQRWFKSEAHKRGQALVASVWADAGISQPRSLGATACAPYISSVTSYRGHQISWHGTEMYTLVNGSRMASVVIDYHEEPSLEDRLALDEAGRWAEFWLHMAAKAQDEIRAIKALVAS